MSNKNLVSLASLLLLANAASLLAQEPTETFTGEVEVVEVLLDVLVTDKEGNVILGLGPSDFLVEEDSEPMVLRGATFYSNRLLVDDPSDTDEPRIAQEDSTADRYFIFLFDDDPGSGPYVVREKQAAIRRAKEWVSESLLPNDFVAVLRYTKKLLVHQDFTNDVRSILAALDEAARGKDPGGNWPSRIAESEGPSLRRSLPQGRSLRDETPRIYEALQVVAEAAGTIIGRKNLLLYSIGFGEVGIGGLIVPDRRYYPSTFQALNNNNVAVYGISMLRDADLSSPLGSSLDSVLTSLASDTGGRYYRNFVNYKTPLVQMVEDNNGYYLLSYSSEAPRGESGYREVEVTTRNPEFIVRARRGYLFGE